jgi:hypothetical protein
MQVGMAVVREVRELTEDAMAKKSTKKKRTRSQTLRDCAGGSGVVGRLHKAAQAPGVTTCDAVSCYIQIGVDADGSPVVSMGVDHGEPGGNLVLIGPVDNPPKVTT